uniref:Uncharacterized protein n=1 Tax=Triticum urartu TaxID=4572 RepID=A0A8R7TM01_TRIUA
MANPARVGWGCAPPRTAAMMEGSAGASQAPDRRARRVAAPPGQPLTPHRGGVAWMRASDQIRSQCMSSSPWPTRLASAGAAPLPERRQ